MTTTHSNVYVSYNTTNIKNQNRTDGISLKKKSLLISLILFAILFLFNLKSEAQTCVSPTLHFNNPVLISGTEVDIGVVYRFNNVLTGINGLVTLQHKSHPDIEIHTLDANASTYGGYESAFQPIVDFNWINNNGTYDSAGEKWVTFNVEFVNASTGLPITLDTFHVSGLDIDGTTDEVREFVESNGFDGYEIQSPSNLTLSESLKAKGAIAEVAGVDETNLESMISFRFLDKSSFTITIGGDYNGSTADFVDNSVFDSDEKLLSSIYLKCFDFNNSVDCPVVSADGGGVFCSNLSKFLSSTINGNSGACQIQWQESNDGINWTDIAGATWANYTTPVISATKHFRVAYTCSGNTSCGTAYSPIQTLSFCGGASCSSTTITTSSNTTVCSGNNSTISASATGGVEPYTFSWSHGLGNGDYKVVSPNSNTGYSVTVTDANGCSDQAQIIVTVNQSPDANAGDDETICRFTSTYLNASASGGVAPYNYSWEHAPGTGNNLEITPLNAATYIVTVTSNNGCIDTDTINVTVQACLEDCSDGVDNDGDGAIDCDDPDCGPTAEAGFNVNICPGDTTFIVASAAGGNGVLEYEWSNGHFGSNQLVFPSNTTTYIVTITAESGCQSIDSVKVSIVPCTEDCTNGVDDDGDGLVDCDDPDCMAIGAPELGDDEFVTCPSLPFTARITNNDNNLQSPIFSIYQHPANGAVNIDGSGEFIFTPAGNNCSEETFMYQVCNQVSGCCATATVTLSFNDGVAPLLTNVPDDITIGCDDNIPTPPNITAFDECFGVFVDFDEESDEYAVGACETFTITRTWTATDLCGNQSSDSQIITIVDDTAPEIFQLYTLENGKQMIAGVAQKVTDEWKFIPFPISFGETPMIFTTVVSNNDMSAVSVRQRNAYSQGFEIRLMEEEGADGLHQQESIAWIAIEKGTNIGNLKLETERWDNVGDSPAALNFSSLFGNNPGVIAAIQSTNEEEPAGVRLNNTTASSVTAFVQEEQSDDAELNHSLEHIGYLSFTPGELLTDKNYGAFGETGKTNLTNAWTTIQLAREYTKPVVVFGGISNNDTDGVNARIRNLTATSFEVRLQEWDYLDGTHPTESVSWIVMEGSIPSNLDFYCSGKGSNLQAGVNVFSVDNCDDQATFNYNESTAVSSTGTVTTREWTAKDDCGNTQVIIWYDTCATAALEVRAILAGAKVKNGGLPNMRDDLRQADLIPIKEPFSSLAAFPNVFDTTPDEGTDNGEPNTNSPATVTVCHRPGTEHEVTLTVPEDALSLHLANGDVQGTCANPTVGIPIGAQTAEFISAQDGDWDDPATWVGNTVPPLGNISGRDIAIGHVVTAQSGAIRLMEGSNMWIYEGGELKMKSGDVRVDEAMLMVLNGTVDIEQGDLLLQMNESKMDMFHSQLNVQNTWYAQKGDVWLQNTCVNVNNKFENLNTNIQFFDVTSIIGAIFENANGSLELYQSKIKVLTGDMFNWNGIVTSDELIVWVETGSLLNYNFWNGDVAQFCVGGTATGLATVLPPAEDCDGMIDYFNTCTNLIGGGSGVSDTSTFYLPDFIALTGTMEPTLLDAEGDEAVVDWLLLEIRDPATEDVLEYATVVLQADGDIVTEDGASVVNFPTLPEGDYLVTLRHRNHLPLVTDLPMFLSIVNPPLIDFSDPALPVRGGEIAGFSNGAERQFWGGDFNGDDKVIYQGPNNDVFQLFSRALGDPENTEFLANYIVRFYDENDFNLDGFVIYQGPNNDRASLLYYSILASPNNSGFLANFISQGFLP